MFCVTAVDGESGQVMEDMRSVQRDIAEGLGLSVRQVSFVRIRLCSVLTYRVLDMPTEELGASAARKYDMEAWMPGRGKWGEVSDVTTSPFKAVLMTRSHQHRIAQTINPVVSISDIDQPSSPGSRTTIHPSHSHIPSMGLLRPFPDSLLRC
jgi:hypothetical protein